MDVLIIKSTKTNPYICFDPSSGKYEIVGKSFSEDPRETFHLVFKWMEDNLKHINHRIEVNLRTDYFNSASNRLLLELFRILERHFKVGKNIEIVWSYSDEEVLNDGVIFSKLVGLPFKFIDKTAG